MSDTVNPAGIVGSIPFDIADVKAKLDTVNKILEHWDILAATGATQGLNKAQLQEMVNLTTKLVDIVENPPPNPTAQ